ncbi:uncharacterized protein LACBIDRAFT_298087 [Laccaria bicolor S238N-H82]|uniref:Predicted protein n=1 Tax=Laccaria bicolor (strain S238N-H82 / ATCC MYA-4686) TaxID=486041 RepID=B0DC74_LACBS|nr:uncharacterized protein LACBIDRAFT_298087 [Laccaria bicolor S238N-H82]EDR07846.1 predicted protein [Laccaria bicolor S238N-H82]|eukprot:XP_001881635.1 predicted protein [Laccaria bicolor S238N-H82]
MPPRLVFLRTLPFQLRFRSYSSSSSSSSNPPIIHIPKANIYPFGASQSTPPALNSIDWTVDEGEAWAVVSRSRGGRGKSILFQTLLGNNRISPLPPSPGLYPFLNGLDPFDGRRLGFVAFRNTGGTRGAGGVFYDYTARYGAVREEDGRTLRDTLHGEGGKVEELVDKLGLRDLLDLPLIALSNGQMRRARIARAVMKTPEVLLLDEPLTGLDPTSRTHLLALLADLHASRSPRIIIGMRAQEELPGWVTHVLDVGEGGVIPMTRERWRGLQRTQRAEEKGKEGRDESKERVEEGELVVDLKGVGVKYGNRTFFIFSRYCLSFACYRSFSRVVFPFLRIRFFPHHSWRTSSISRVPFRFPELPLSPFVKARGGIYKGRMLWFSSMPSPDFMNPVLFLGWLAAVVLYCKWASRVRHYGLRKSTSRRILDSPPTHLLRAFSRSGKTTLLSLLTGDHPQSYTQAHLHLPSLSPATSSNPSFTTHPYRTHHLNSRKRTPTAHLRTLIGVVSPELFDAFPRRHPGMTVWEAVVTGFGGVLSRLEGARGWEQRRREIEKWRIARCWDVLSALGPRAWSTSGTPETEREFAVRRFTALTPGEQRIVLLMRALVSRPPLVLLDEVWSGMDEGMISAVRRYLTTEGGVGEAQAVVVITHWEEEDPWGGQGVRRFRIWEGGGGVV